MSQSSTHHVAILTIGNELLDGRVRDTNAQTIADSLRRAGFMVQSIVTVNDEVEEIQGALKFLFARCSSVIVSGGLGPTSDDLTREAVAALFGAPLQRDESVVAHLQALFAERRRTMHASNLRQADFPLGAKVLSNPKGTACGFSIRGTRAPFDGAQVFCLPGVPHELEHMLNDEVLPLLEYGDVARTPPVTKMLKTFGRTESEIASIIEQLDLPKQLHVGYRAAFPEVHLTFVSQSGSTERAEHAAALAREALGSECIVTEDPKETIEQLLVRELRQRGQTVSFAESCTGGLMASALTSVAGASEVFQGGVVCYANEVKIKALGVPSIVIEQHGAVSAQCAEAMATGAIDRFHTHYAVAVTGIAGPAGGTRDKPVGTFYVALAAPGVCQSFRYFIGGSRSRVRGYATTTALDVLRRALLGYSLRNGTPS